MDNIFTGYAEDGTLTAGCVVPKQKRTPEMEECLLEIMSLRRRLVDMSEDIDKNHRIDQEWSDWLGTFFTAAIDDLDNKYDEFRDRFEAK
jgi:hypothetical protein